ncbi:MAG: M48 family metalloprotease, partial [Desulfatibacillaceae bacterium]|nr:M48 family metalloprotease [Desulfatibacillaceae bacterium]
GLVFFGLLYTPVEMALSVGINALSRFHEYQADAFAAQTTGRPKSMADALKRLSKDSLQNLTPHPFFVWLHHTHPPVLERIRAITPDSKG